MILKTANFCHRSVSLSPISVFFAEFSTRNRLRALLSLQENAFRSQFVGFRFRRIHRFFNEASPCVSLRPTFAYSEQVVPQFPFPSWHYKVGFYFTNTALIRCTELLFQRISFCHQTISHGFVIDLESLSSWSLRYLSPLTLPLCCQNQVESKSS